MNPSMSLLLAEDHRNRLAAARDSHVKRMTAVGADQHFASRARLSLGALLVLVGTRLAGPRAGPIGLRRPPA